MRAGLRLSMNPSLACIAQGSYTLYQTSVWYSDMPSLSSKQLEVLDFIQQFMATHGLPPTRGEIAAGLGLKNRQGIDQHLRALAGKGAIELTPGISRGIKLSSTGPSRARAMELDGLPLLGRIAAGSPILATGNIEDRIQVDRSLFRPRADFLLRVRGDSMKDADILDRDLLAVHQTTEVHDGQIVVARIGEEATVKYYRRLDHRVRLEPANPAYQPIEIDLQQQELTIEGLAVGIIRTGLNRTQ
jgi:repressor LexA